MLCCGIQLTVRLIIPVTLQIYAVCKVWYAASVSGQCMRQYALEPAWCQSVAVSLLPPTGADPLIVPAADGRFRPITDQPVTLLNRFRF